MRLGAVIALVVGCASEAPSSPSVQGRVCATSSECAPDEYCATSDTCASGHCSPRPLRAVDSFSPSCGCDGITYWNASYAAVLGTSVPTFDGGACSGATAVRCSATKPCPTPANHCVPDAPTDATSCAEERPGTCWFWASTSTCDGDNTALVHPCTGFTGKCDTQCRLLLSNRSGFTDAATCGASQ